MTDHQTPTAPSPVQLNDLARRLTNPLAGRLTIRYDDLAALVVYADRYAISPDAVAAARERLRLAAARGNTHAATVIAALDGDE